MALCRVGTLRAAACVRHARGAFEHPWTTLPPLCVALTVAQRVIYLPTTESASGFPDCLLTQMPQLVTAAAAAPGGQKAGVKRPRVVLPQARAPAASPGPARLAQSPS
jgi:hypothetical protein